MRKFKYIICLLLILVTAPVFFVACDTPNEVANLTAENDDLKTELNELEEKYNALQNVRINQENEVKKLKEEVQKLEAQNASHLTHINELEERLTNTEATKNSLLLTNMSLQKQLNDKNTDLINVKASLIASNSEIEELETEIEELKNQIATNKAEITSLTNMIATKNQELQTAQTNLNETTNNLAITNQNLEQKQAELNTTIAELDKLTAENNALTQTTSKIIVFTNETFTENPTLENNTTYMFVGCAFNQGLYSLANKIDVRLYDCTISSNNGKGLYLTSFINLEVIGCTFVNDTNGPSATNGIDLNIYNTNVQNITIAHNTFNFTSTDQANPCIAISIKTRLGKTDNPTEEFWSDKTEGKILGDVVIEGNNFIEGTNNNIHIGTNPQGTDTEANLTSGAFDVIVRNNRTPLKVYENYLYANGEIPSGYIVMANETAGTLGNKTSK